MLENSVVVVILGLPILALGDLQPELIGFTGLKVAAQEVAPPLVGLLDV